MAPKTPNTQRTRSDLDKSIDMGLDQFGRFVKTKWLWIALVIFAFWFFTSGVSIAGIDPGILLGGILQISFAIFYILIQFVALFWFLGRPRLYWVMPGETGVTFDDYKGNPEVLESARRVVTLLRGVKEFQEIGGSPIRGLLLSGPPGTGKSYLAQCMSTEAGVPFAYASASSFRAMFMGMDVLMIMRLYRKARRLAREYGGCVIFLDEIDAIGGSRGGNATMGMGGGMFGMMGGGSGGLNQLLMEMDPPNIETGWFKKVLRILGLYHGRAQREPVLTVGATNIPESLDAALLRPGRFDRQINVAPPTDKYRPEVIEYYLKKVKYDLDIPVSAVSARLVDYTPVAIKHVINEAAIIAHFDGRDQVRYKDIVEAQDVHEFGLRQIAELTPIDRRRLAYHEAGHSVASYYLYSERMFPAYVTIHMRSDLEGAAAFANTRQKETIVTFNDVEILTQIQVKLAARACEELFLNTRISGVTSDFASATKLAEKYVGLWGMDGTIVSMRADGGSANVPHMAERVEEVLQSQMKAVKKLLMEHSDALIAIAEALIDRDELVAEEIKELIDRADARKASLSIMRDLTPLLEVSNGHNGQKSNGNGHSNGNGAGHLTSPRSEGSTLNYQADSSIPPAPLE